MQLASDGYAVVFIVLLGFNFIFLHFELIVINIINIPKNKGYKI